MDKIKKYGHKSAFTLAEVLITLAIIGVVAALTIPTVVTNYQAKALETQKKKSMSVLANGMKLLMANDDAGAFEDTNLISCEDKECYANEIKKVFNVLADNQSENEIFNKEYQFESESRPVWTNDSIKYAFITSDGMIFGLVPEGDSSLSIIADVNGAKNPNKGTSDLCGYLIKNTGAIEDHCSDMRNWGVAPVNPGPTCDEVCSLECDEDLPCEEVCEKVCH